MKNRLFSTSRPLAYAVVIAVCLLASPEMRSQSADEMDVIFRRGNQSLLARIVGLQGRFLRVEVLLRADQPPATLSIPLQDLTKIVFAERKEERALLDNPTRETLPAIYRIWQAKQPFLGVDNSDAGDFGLASARLLLESTRESDLLQAMDLFELIHARDWKDSRNALAKQGKLRAMLRLGRAEEAIAEARELAESSEDPAVLLEARFVLAEASLRELKSLLEDNPRWEEDPWVRPERNRLYHETLDLLLNPALFYGTEIEHAARGLALAMELHDLSKEPAKALELADDLITLYPDTPEAVKAAEYVQTHRKETTENEPEPAKS